ncbi:hypothetical protein ACFOTA_21700 [Chitinophaga sp. GCM10012297]|uniref:Uncharacterized protein n=1 Tax=Chitinophaga chungangae TaxID=2821488 RepID=A0ABS3YJI2_9BACT|nr:hypothetical protein [Chitinophaga chungangae]MBO9154844.1 hypothetical protein [Chitinophaga chungangae]
MKTFKFNFAFFVAILAMSAALTTHAGIFGKRVITRCFTEVGLFNCMGSYVILDGNANPPALCSEATELAASHPTVASASLANSIPGGDVCGGGDFFCCLTVSETSPADPEYNCSPFLDLGEGFKKYKVEAVYCKEIR